MRKLAVYILECSDGTFYTGVTNNLERRMTEHQAGRDSESYTYSRRPVKLVWHEYYSPPRYAIEIEKKIKRWSHAKKAALINEQWDLLVLLAKKNFKKK